ncbi:MAG: hypothetical protein Q9181_008036 [Wetmoreana brouardii]
MKSLRFGTHKLPFRRSERAAQEPLDEEEDSLDEEEDSLDEEEDSLDKEEDSLDKEEKQPTQEEQFDSVVVKEEEIGSDGEECELHVYESKYDTRGEQVILRAGTKSEIKPPKRKSHRACLVLNRQYDRQGKVSYTELEIQSRHVIGALRKVIGTYHGVDFTTKAVTILEPPRCLFHYQDELRQHAEASDNEQEKSHIQLCLQYMEKSLHREIKISKLSHSPELEHRDLWIAFKPGCLIYEKVYGIERLSRLRSIHEEEDEDDEIEYWILHIEKIQYSGEAVGLVEYSIKIKRYTGCKPICELEVSPLHLHSERERIQYDLLKRGRKYLSLWGIHHCFYDGVALFSRTSESDYQETNVRVNRSSFETFFVSNKQSLQVKHRIMLDLAQYPRTIQGSFQKFISGTKIFTSGLEANAKLSDEEIMTSYDCIPGYSLELKQWSLFLVTNVTEIAYNDKAFHGLVLQEQKKRLISSLLESQDCQQDDGFDDLIQGKGKGLIFLLHGPPGVGKTYTAESIADHTRRPLLKAHAADVCGPGSLVEQRMTELFQLAAKWNGILLLDEADVYMQDRALHDPHTNQLVSSELLVVFLLGFLSAK